MTSRANSVWAIALTACLFVGCSKEASSQTTANGEPAGTLVVFAAASLTDAFDDVAAEFRQQYPHIEVKLNYAGSQSLRTQIQQGAQPDVFASANANHMHALASAGLVEAPRDFASNEMVIAVPASNPAGIQSIADLPNADRLVLAGDAVPAGQYAKLVLENAAARLGNGFMERVNKKVVSREMHVRQTLQKVVLGEADAAIVYATDAAAAGDKIKSIAIASEHNVRASYPVAAVKQARNERAAMLFVEFLASDAGRARLEANGFDTPSPTKAANAQ